MCAGGLRGQAGTWDSRHFVGGSVGLGGGEASPTSGTRWTARVEAARDSVWAAKDVCSDTWGWCGGAVGADKVCRPPGPGQQGVLSVKHADGCSRMLHIRGYACQKHIMWVCSIGLGHEAGCVMGKVSRVCLWIKPPSSMGGGVCWYCLRSSALRCVSEWARK